MSQPDYKRPFNQVDFRGYFRWSQVLTRKIGGYLYHACHVDELRGILAAGQLDLRSKWSLKLPHHGLWESPGVWTGLNNYRGRGNYYGPCLMRFPLAVLNGRNFMAFRRESADRNRHFFVQYESRLPIYSYEKESWRTINAGSYFKKSGKRLVHMPGAIYDIVLTQPLLLDSVIIRGVDHPKCIPAKCSGSSQSKSERQVRKVATEEWQQLMIVCEEYQMIMSRFPGLEGGTVKLFDPVEEIEEPD